jgi:hypothetical protein
MDPEKRLALIALLAKDQAWDAVVLVGRALLEHYYPAAVFDGSSGDTGPEYVVALRKALERIQPESPKLQLPESFRISRESAPHAIIGSPFLPPKD